MTPERCWELLQAAEVAVLATIGLDGAPDLVPVVFAATGSRTLVSPVDQKPKTTRRLRRLENVEVDPRVSLLVQHWEADDWSRLWWVRAEGSGRVAEEAIPGAMAALASRYPAYRSDPPLGPWIVVDVERMVGWEAASSGGAVTPR